SEDRACQWHQGCNLKRSGEFGVSPFCGQQLPASKERDGARKLHGSRNNAYGCFGSERPAYVCFCPERGIVDGSHRVVVMT
ncbi:hypothetical protein ABIB99_009038, partial [Bradyrhizobium sp. LA6.1]|uniref:hypothetical protein n=1 Tax=Bradyrhizobium sp. LA6.1 TaxID=3156378 RepID=UPI00339B6F43